LGGWDYEVHSRYDHEVTRYQPVRPEAAGLDLDMVSK